MSRGLASGAVGFVAFGGWATIANWSHGTQARTVAGLTQGLLSFCTTFLIAMLAELIVTITKRAALQLALSTLGMATLLLLSLSAVHTAVGTPEVVRTITPSVISGSLFSTLYVLALRRAERGAGGAGASPRVGAQSAPSAATSDG